MTSSAERMRAWTGPALLSHGFRPFFLGAALWAVLAMALWLAMLPGALSLPLALDPVSWHAHAFLFGYLGAVVAGFMLTAVPNWTGRLPIVGGGLGALAGLWLAGRAAMAVSAWLPAWVTAAIDLAFPLALAAVLAREIVAGRNWRNLPVLGMLAAFIVGNAVFHLEVARGAFAAQGTGLRIGLAAAVMMIALIGGRIVPSFTRNWLVKRSTGPLPVPPMQLLDRVALVALLAALLLWIALPEHRASGAALILAGALHIVRLARWQGHRTLAEPLVAVLHAGYLLVPLGALAVGAEMLALGPLGLAAAQHLWTAGAIATMTLAVMTRATLGHTGRPLTAGAGTTAIYAAILASLLARLAAGVWPAEAMLLHVVAGGAWVAAFAGFAAVYGSLLLRPKPPH